MIRKAFVMQVNPDAHEEYRRRHNPILPELEADAESAWRAPLCNLPRQTAPSAIRHGGN